MKSIEELRAEQAKALAELQAEHEIANSLPIVPDSVIAFPATREKGWVSYKRKTLSECVDTMRAFVVVPFDAWRDGCLRLQPESCIKMRENTKHEGGPYACMISTNQGEGFGPTAELTFFTRVAGKVLRINCKFGAGYIDTCPELGATVEIVRGRGNRIESRTYKANPHLYAFADKHVYWVSGDHGPIKNSARHSHCFMAEGDEETQGGECEHAIDQLTNLAEAAKV